MQPLRAVTECEVDLVRKRPDHGIGLRPWMPQQPTELYSCATESHTTLTRTSPCEIDRIEALPKVVRDIGWKAQVRLCARYRRLTARGKTANVVNVAIAREMVGFIWSIARTIQSAPRAA